MEMSDGKLYRESPLFTFDSATVGENSYCHGDCILFHDNKRGRIVGISADPMERHTVLHVVPLVSIEGKAANTLYYDFRNDEITLNNRTAQIKKKLTVDFSGSPPASGFGRLNNWL